MFIFLDEAGNFKSKKENYFIVGGFITGDPKRTAKTFRKWQTKKFPAKIRYKTEVKFSDSGLNENLRLATLQYFCDQDIRIFYSFLNRLNIPLEYRKKKQIQTGLLYAEIVGKTLSLLLPANDSEFRVFRDRRHLKNSIIANSIINRADLVFLSSPLFCLSFFLFYDRIKKCSENYLI